MVEIRWGMIGCGDVTERKSAPAFNQVAHSALAAVMGRNPAKVEDYARRHNVPRWTTDAARLVNDPEVNAIYIATPPDSHAFYTRMAAEAGKPVYVEKPMARTFAECQAMIEDCRRAGVPLFVAYYRRCLPAFLKVKELVESGAIGDVRFVSVQLIHPPHPGDQDGDARPWRVIPEIAGGGHFYDLASHQLDYLDFLFGPVISAAGQSANQAGWYPAEDIVLGHWQHESGVLGSGEWCFSAAPGQQRDRAEIVGSRGCVTFSFFEEIPVRLETSGRSEVFSFPRRDPIQKPLIEQIVAELRGEGMSPSTGQSAARANWVMEQISTIRKI